MSDKLVLPVFNRFIALPGDSKEDILIKQVWVILALASFIYPVTEGIILMTKGLYDVNVLLRFLMSGLIGVLIIVFLIRKRDVSQLGFWLSFILIFGGGIIQFRMGGLLHSAGIVFITLAAATLSLIFTSIRSAHFLFALFLLMTLGGTFLQPYMSSETTAYPAVYKAMYIAKFLTGSLALYLMTLYFQIQLRRIKESEKQYMQALDSAKTKFYTNMTHEFRTPLSMISGWTDQIAENKDKYLEEGIESIKRNSSKLLALVNQLMDISKLEAGSMPLHKECKDIVPLIKSATESHRGGALLKNIKLHLIRDSESLVMDHDSEKVEAVMNNILSNAIKFTPAGGDVYVQVFVQSDNLYIKIRDTGPGIPEEHLPRVFDRFYQVDDSSTRKAGGSGIGLAVTKGLVDLMGGHIRVSSLEGEGATFTVCLPVTTDAGPGMSGMLPEKETDFTFDRSDYPVATNGNSDDPLILVVEDHAEMLHFLDTILREDYRVIKATDGKQGLQIAIEQVPDIIISDIMMPEMDGYDLCKALKADIRTSHIPVVLLTAKADMESRIHGIELGAEAYLSKPFDKRELLARISTIFDNRRTLQDHYKKYHSMNGDPANEMEVSPPERDFLSRVRGLIQDRIDDPQLNVEALAKELHMSYSQLYRKIRSVTGTTPVQLIRDIRLNTARQLLLSTDQNISEIAFQVGFEDPVYFTRLFKKLFGATPSDFRAHAVNQKSEITNI